jgi:hypothetical protein
VYLVKNVEDRNGVEQPSVSETIATPTAQNYRAVKYLINRTLCHQMSTNSSASAEAQNPLLFGRFSASESSLRRNVRAKYYPNADGTLRLATVQEFSVPFFMPRGWEFEPNGSFHNDIDNDIDPEEFGEDGYIQKPGNAERARRRARIATYDLIMSNPQLDSFVTMTYSPEAVSNKADYAECYQKLRPFLSNSVQRRGLMYVGVPELTKKGDVHFHFLANKGALELERARSPYSGRALSHNGDPIYNVTNWHNGFTTAQIIRPRHEGDDGRAACCKYIFKYIGKENEMIGGRYYLSGGKLARPIYKYGDTAEEFIKGAHCTYDKTAQIPSERGDLTYRLYSFT